MNNKIPTPNGLERFGHKPPQQPPKAKLGFWAWLSGLLNNPATGRLSHTKLWANVAAAVMTWKFVQMPEPPEWLWLVYGGSVGGYALIKRGMAVVPQLAEINKKGQNHAADFE